MGQYVQVKFFSIKNWFFRNLLQKAKLKPRRLYFGLDFCNQIEKLKITNFAPSPSLRWFHAVLSMTILIVFLLIKSFVKQMRCKNNLKFLLLLASRCNFNLWKNIWNEINTPFTWNINKLINFYSSRNYQKIYGFLMILGWIEVNQFAQIRLILEAKWRRFLRLVLQVTKTISCTWTIVWF